MVSLPFPLPETLSALSTLHKITAFGCGSLLTLLGFCFLPFWMSRTKCAGETQGVSVAHWIFFGAALVAIALGLYPLLFLGLLIGIVVLIALIWEFARETISFLGAFFSDW